MRLFGRLVGQHSEEEAVTPVHEAKASRRSAEARLPQDHHREGDAVLKKPRCDWPGFKCGSESEFYYRNIGDQTPGARRYAARCSIHIPDLKTSKVGGLPRSWFKRISFEEYVVAQVMES
jgi:hypothetical protein